MSQCKAAKVLEFFNQISQRLVVAAVILFSLYLVVLLVLLTRPGTPGPADLLLSTAATVTKAPTGKLWVYVSIYLSSKSIILNLLVSW